MVLLMIMEIQFDLVGSSTLNISSDSLPIYDGEFYSVMLTRLELIQW